MQLINLSKQMSRIPISTSLLLMSANNTLFKLEPHWSQCIPATISLALGGIRTKLTKSRQKQRVLEGEEVIRCHGFNYFPRFPGHVDPPYEPTKLFAIQRVRSLKRCPYWERRIVEGELKLASRRTVTIVKNTPSQNKTLHSVKHLIQITPITFPNGMPTDARNGFLKENGEFIVYNRLAPIGVENILELQGDVDALRKRDVDGATLKKRLSLQWQGRW